VEYAVLSCKFSAPLHSECSQTSTVLQPFVEPWPLLNFLIFYTASRTPWASDQPVARSLPTHRTTQIQNKCTQTSMPQVGFEHTIPVFEGAKTVHTANRAATVIVFWMLLLYVYSMDTLPVLNTIIILNIITIIISMIRTVAMSLSTKKRHFCRICRQIYVVTPFKMSHA
jgi:hypothetical protein